MRILLTTAIITMIKDHRVMFVKVKAKNVDTVNLRRMFFVLNHTVFAAVCVVCIVRETKKNCQLYHLFVMFYIVETVNPDYKPLPCLKEYYLYFLGK